VVEQRDTTGLEALTETTLKGWQNPPEKQLIGGTPSGCCLFSVTEPVVSLRSTTG
jgi:hypothetical protein